MNENPPLTGIVQSALTILIVFLVTPLFTGGAIALAVEYGDEKLHQQTPEDKNGFALYNSKCPTLNNPQTLGSSSNPTYTQSLISTTAPNPNYQQQQYTKLQYSVMAGSSHDIYCNSKSPDTIIFPNDIFAYQEPHTSFNFELFSTSSISNGNWKSMTVDMDFRVNNETFVFLDDVPIGGQSAPSKFQSRVSHTYTLVEYNDLVKHQAECETSCEYKVEFSDLTTTQCIGSYCPDAFMSTIQYVKLETYTSDEISSDLVLTVAPWILGGIYMIIALASTPLWNPIFKETQRRISNV